MGEPSDYVARVCVRRLESDAKADPQLRAALGTVLPLDSEAGRSLRTSITTGSSKASRARYIPTAPAGLYFPGDPGFPDTGGPMNNKWWIFNPRVGLAWDVTG